LDLGTITISPLGENHDLSRFFCGESQLDKFINKKAKKYHLANRIKVFCAHPRGKNAVYGLYTLTMKWEETDKLLRDESQFLSDKHFSAIYIGTLAVAHMYQRNRLGTILLIDALRRAYFISQNVAVFGVALRSLNAKTTKFYERHGFGLRDDGLTPLMVLPVWSLNDLFGQKDKI
jgi:ribosomal protein S18 acetylase RimI-like enzyme